MLWQSVVGLRLTTKQQTVGKREKTADNGWGRPTGRYGKQTDWVLKHNVHIPPDTDTDKPSLYNDIHPPVQFVSAFESAVLNNYSFTSEMTCKMRQVTFTVIHEQ
ncbi:hypothetical protein BaRGS_00023475 [Batillaria attramentaria]|uniref:Uncharacterized protein n=1 Tax=Batillaria attramentaria TaxID=370345 RepID=A0ABD0KDJ3_9CAEN